MSTNFPDGVQSYGVPTVGNFPISVHNYWFVDKTYGNNAFDGHSPQTAFQTITRALVFAQPLDAIMIAPGGYDESVIMTGDKSDIVLMGMGHRGEVAIAPSSANATALEVRGDDVTLINVGCAGDDTGAFALRVYGSRFRAYGCKFEGNSGASIVCVKYGPGTVAQHAATGAAHYGNAGDGLFDDCEFCWAHHGLEIFSSNYGAGTEIHVRNCLFHDLDGEHVRSNDIAGSNVCTRALWVHDCIFENSEEAVAPSKFVNVAVTGDTGHFAVNSFAIATNAVAKLAIAAGVLWTANRTEAGSSTARPA